MYYRGGIFNKPNREFNNFLQFSYIKANLFLNFLFYRRWQGQIQNKKSMDQNSLYSKLKK